VLEWYPVIENISSHKINQVRTFLAWRWKHIRLPKRISF